MSETTEGFKNNLTISWWINLPQVDPPHAAVFTISSQYFPNSSVGNRSEYSTF